MLNLLPICPHLAPTGPLWPPLAPSGLLRPPMAPSGPLWPLLAPYAPIPDWSRKSIQQSIPSTRGPLWHASARLVTSTSLSAPGSLGTKDPCPLERASLNLLLFLGILLFMIIFDRALLRPAIPRLSSLYLEYVCCFQLDWMSCSWPIRWSHAPQLKPEDSTQTNTWKLYINSLPQSLQKWRQSQKLRRPQKWRRPKNGENLKNGDNLMHHSSCIMHHA